MDENKKYNYYYNYMTPLKIVAYNNFLKSLIIKKNNYKAKTVISSHNNINIYTNTIDNKPLLIPSLIPKLKKTVSEKNLHEISIVKSPKKNIIEKSDVFIDVEINNISDLLDLINKYKVDSNINYNINMTSLHKIKEPLIELNNMIGMKDLKTNIVEQIIYFIQELHSNSDDFMHTVIYGPPGTGKTEIAKIMGKIFSNIGILSKDTFKKVTRSDLIAGYVGQTALKTRDIIKESLGGVLFIDEAYSLGNSEKKDTFSKECIDTLCEGLSNYKHDLMVIIAGYENELNDCFFNYNQGLESRFVWRFKTDEYNGKDLYDIFIKKITDIGWCICEKEQNITPKWFEKNIEYFKYYGRDIESLLAKTKIAHSKRVFCKDKTSKKKLILEDLENGMNLFLKNKETKNFRENMLIKKQIQYSMYN